MVGRHTYLKTVIQTLRGFAFVALVCVPLAQGQIVPDPDEVHSSAQNSTEAGLPENTPQSQADSGSANGAAAAPAVNARPPLPPRRIFGIVPNYRTVPDSNGYRPISPRQKFNIATQESFDRGTVALAALFAGEAQLTKSTPSFGHGASGYARYFAASFTDFVVGNYMTEAVYPTMFHQDPRYFRRGTGSAWSRLGSAVKQSLWTRADSGRMQFNFSEILGNSTGVAISNVYYRDNRNASDAATRFGIQIGLDTAANILKEFSPELSSIFSRKHSASSPPKIR